jgi:hypothetical protein
MMASLMRAAVVLGGCICLTACSQQASQSSGAEAQSQDAQRARLCIAEGQPGHTALTDPWSITVSSEGPPCPHAREAIGAGRSYEVLEPPQHGRITQEPREGLTVISYTPDRGYIGGDRFALRYPGRNVALPYYVGVIP